MIIYKIINLINNKIYIGLTTRPIEIRFKEHIGDAITRNRQTPIHRSIRKYGIENFKIEEIDKALDIELLNEKEKYWISFYNSTDKEIGYNNKEGGSNGKHLPETIEKIKIGLIGRYCSEETKIKLRKNKPPDHTGKKRRIETLEKMSKSQQGRKMPDHVREAIRKSTVGRKQTPEEIEKRMKKIRGVKKPEGVMENLRLSNIGRKRNPESIQKMRDSKKGKYIGENNKNSILNNEIVIKIKTDLFNGERICNISRKYTISQNLIKNIKYNRSWSHIII